MIEERLKNTEEFGIPEWDDDDNAMKAIASQKWRHVIAHECGQAIASLANSNCPDRISIGQLVDEISGETVHSLAVNSGLPDDAPRGEEGHRLARWHVGGRVAFGVARRRRGT